MKKFLFWILLGASPMAWTQGMLEKVNPAYWFDYEKGAYPELVEVDGLKYHFYPSGQVNVCCLHMDRTEQNHDFINAGKGLPTSVTFQGKKYFVVAFGTKFTNGNWSDVPPMTLVLPEGYELLQPDAFRGLKIEQIAWPKSIEEIGIAALESNELQSVIIPAQIRNLNRRAFANNTQLKHVVIEAAELPIRFGGFYGEYVEPVDGRLYEFSPFYNCPLEYFKLDRDINANDGYDGDPRSDGELRICDMGLAPFEAPLLEGQDKLSTIEIGENVTSIPDRFFWGCSGLESVICHATTPPAMSDAAGFDSPNECSLSKTQLLVPEGLETIYANAPGWKNFTIINGTANEVGIRSAIQANQPRIAASGGTLTVTNCSPGSVVKVFAPNGQLLVSATADHLGNATVEQPSGVILVAVGEATTIRLR